MCFYSRTNKFKIAIRPIRVYKWLSVCNKSPFFNYEYQKGLNVPNTKPRFKKPIDNCLYYSYTAGVLHAFKNGHFNSVEMYIPIGARYNDNGILVYGDIDCRDHIISTKLYWPKNKFEAWWYNLISKKY